MRSMQALRIRVGRLSSVESHPVRKIEHSAFSRLMYRNRSQHRHGLYFRKLEHVRRLLKKIQSHVAWHSLRYSLGHVGQGERRSLSQIPLSISSVTLEDIKAMEILYDSLVSTVLPKAAIAVATELVCRQHFLPFSISMIAVLARLFVIERKILTELKGIVVEFSLLLSIEDQKSAPLPNNGTNNYTHEDEDVGLPLVKSVEEKNPMALKESKISTMPRHVGESLQASPSNHTSPTPKDHNLKLGKHQDGPSLYEIIQAHDEAAQFPVELKSKASVTLPDVIGKSATSKSGDALQKGEKEIPLCSLANLNKRLREQNEDDTERPKLVKHKPNCSSSENSSDSGDIDDIFGDLE